VLRFFKKAFAGILVTDFWGAYNTIVCAGKQKCLVLMLGDMKKVAKYKDKSGDWPVFAKRLKRILRDLSLQQRHSTLENTKYERLCASIERRMTQLIESPRPVGAKCLVEQHHIFYQHQVPNGTKKP